MKTHLLIKQRGQLQGNLFRLALPAIDILQIILK